MEEKEIDLLELWKVVKKNLIKYVLIGIIFALASYAISQYLITPKYESSVSLIVNSEEGRNNQGNIQLNELQLNQKLVGTYTQIIKTRGISDLVMNNLGLDLSHEKFLSMVSVSSKNNTEIFEVKVRDTIAQRAADIANETANVFKDSIVNIMKVDNVQVLDKAIVAKKPVSPNINKNVLLGFILGFILSMFISVLKFLTDTTIKTSEDITNEFGLPVIGIIPDRNL